MIAHEATHEHPATSLSRFFAAHAKQYQQMASSPAYVTRSDKFADRENETLRLYELHKNGASINECAEIAGVTNAAMGERFRRRGLKTFVRRAKQCKK